MGVKTVPMAVEQVQTETGDSVTLGGPIARGRTAEIYAWGDNRILKLCFDWVPEDAVRYEAQVASAVHATGMPVPGVGDVLAVGPRWGVVYERIEGSPMFGTLAAKPWLLARHARSLAALHAEMHRIAPTADLPSQRPRLQDKIRHAQGLEERLKAASLAALARMPDGNRLCHGDFHPDNVLMTEDGPVIIDWIDVTLGNPLADVARTSVILLGVQHSQSLSRIQRALLALYHKLYLRHYFRLRPGGERDVLRWRPIIAAARMSEGIGEIADWLHEQVRAGLA